MMGGSRRTSATPRAPSTPRAGNCRSEDQFRNLPILHARGQNVSTMRSFPGKVLLAAALLCAGFACDDEPQPPPELLEQARKTDDEDGPKRPTTQELLQ